VPGPPPSSASAEVGAAASSDAVSLGLAGAASVALAEGRAVADAVALGEGVAFGDSGVLALVVGVEPLAAKVDEVDPAGALGVMGLGVDLVGLGLGFGGVGALVLAGAGGAMPGCCPEPNRKPTTEPGTGSYVATPIEL
jgi:hypothetical protein